MSQPSITQSVAAAVLLALVVLLAAPLAGAEESCACRFQQSDPADCRVYGQLGDGVLIPWHRASQECLDVFNIKDEAIPPSTLDSIFPDGLDGEPRVSSMVSYLRFTSDAVSTGIKLSLTDFFVQDASGSAAVFKEEIVVDGQTVNCEDSQSACWRAVTDYFNTDEGMAVLKDIGETLYMQQAVSKEKEQSLVRIRLCSDGADPDCGALSDQVQDYVQDLGDSTFCSAYGLGPNTDDLPYCTATSPTIGGGTGSSGGGSGSSGGDTVQAGTMSDSQNSAAVSSYRYLNVALTLAMTVMMTATVALGHM